MTATTHKPSSYSQAVVTDIAVGMVAGLAAAGAMHLFQVGWAKFIKAPTEMPATAKAADTVADAVTGDEVPEGYRVAASNCVHYVTGALIGGVYGLLAGLQPMLTTGRGILFGAVTWLAGDELAVPALGFGPPPSEVDKDAHLYGALSHAVFALTLDQVRRRLNVAIARHRNE